MGEDDSVVTADEATVSDWLHLMKPGVLLLLQITAMCAILIHDLIEVRAAELAGLDASLDWMATGRVMLIVAIGGFLTAGGAHTINNVLDRDIDPGMNRTAHRAIARGAIDHKTGLVFGIFLAGSGTAFLVWQANEVAAFWAAFSVLFYVFIYTLWLKRRSVQNIVIGGIAGATPPLVGWAAAEGANLSISNPFALASPLPWLMFVLIFIWTPPHFWALALYRSDEYAKVGVPMMPGVKGGQRTLSEMKVYSLALIGLAAMPWLAVDEVGELTAYTYSLLALMLGIWYNHSVVNIHVYEKKDDKGRIPSAVYSFYVSLKYLALMFVALVVVLISVELTLVLLVLLMLKLLQKLGNTRKATSDSSSA
jgi:protoheme IX farnesyltransferase